MSRVSVITTSFNEEAWIADAVRSVMAQTESALEHIVVDDGSSDATLAVLDGFQHLRVLEVTNRGQAAAQNAGLIALDPRADWVVFLDGDDWLEPNFIEEALKVSARADVIFTGRRRHWDDGRVSAVSLPAVQNPTEADLWDACHGHSCAMVRRSRLVECGGLNTRMNGDHDWDLWIDLARRGATFAYTEATHYHYRVRADSWSREFGEMYRPGNIASTRSRANTRSSSPRSRSRSTGSTARSSASVERQRNPRHSREREGGRDPRVVARALAARRLEQRDGRDHQSMA